MPQRVIITSVGINVVSNAIKNIINSVAEKAEISEICSKITVVMKVRFRGVGSVVRWFWLAKIINGVSQHDRISSGAEIWSTPK